MNQECLHARSLIKRIFFHEKYIQTSEVFCKYYKRYDNRNKLTKKKNT